MKKIVYFCTLMFIVINSMAQTEISQKNWQTSNDFNPLEKYLRFQYSSSQVPVADGWIIDTVFSDEFDKTSLNAYKWYDNDGHIHENNLHVGSVSQNVQVKNGKLFLSAYYDPIGVRMKMDNNTYYLIHYLTGCITSNYYIRYGYYEVECYLPNNHNLRPCFWLWGEVKEGEHDSYNDYNEVDVNENPGDILEIQHNIYTNYKRPNFSGTRQHLHILDTLMGKTTRFGVEVLPYELVWYINGRVSSHLRYTNDTANVNSFGMFTYSDITKTRPMQPILSFNISVDTLVPAIPSPYEDFTIEYFRCYKMERGRPNTYHPSVFTPSAESCKVYPNVILGGSGYTAVVNTSTAVWAEQSIILDEGFTLTAGNTFSARIIQHGTENPEVSPLYIGNYIHEHTK